MGATFTITAELTRQGLLEAKEAIDRILGAQDTSAEAKPDGSPVEEQKARLFREWAGDKSWDFIHAIASTYEAHQEFTFEDLSKALGVSVATVKSWHRSASKPMNRVDRELDKGAVVAAKILNSRWDGVRQHYWMSEEMRSAVLKAGG